jgi:hypothetical protein
MQHYDQALAPTLDSSHQAKLQKLSTDPKQIARSLKRALIDAQELIGKCSSPAASDSKRPRSSQPPSPADCDAHTAVKNPTHYPATSSNAERQTPRAPFNLMQVITAILAAPIATPTPSQFRFTLLDPSAARHNAAILRNVDCDLRRALRNESSASPLQFGSEFWSTAILAPLLGHHPQWYKIHSLLEDGCTFLADPLDEVDCLIQIEHALDFGNHKGALKHPVELHALLTEDVTHGFNLPVDLRLAHTILGLVLSPMNIARQNTIDETGRVIEKDRLTHDHSYNFFPQSSINSRCQLDLHEPCLFGKALSRIFHWIIHLRSRFPHNRILITKTDWKAAYRRAHLAIQTALECATRIDDILLIPLRMTFGGAPCPSQWSVLSDAGCDLATDLANNPDWDPLTLHSPHQHRLTAVPPAPATRPAPHPAQELLFDFPSDDTAIHHKFDNYIDDLLGMGVETDTDSVQRLCAAGSLVIHTLARP